MNRKKRSRLWNKRRKTSDEKKNDKENKEEIYYGKEWVDKIRQNEREVRSKERK